MQVLKEKSTSSFGINFRQILEVIVLQGL